MRGLIAILMLLLPSVCCAEIVGIQTVGQCYGSNCDTTIGYGSGVIVGTLHDGRAGILTAGHVVSGSQAVYVHWYRGQRLAATVLGSRKDAMVDAAILAVNIPGEFNCNELSDRVTPDADVTVGGFPEAFAAVKHYRGILSGREIHRVTVKQGMSGGPVMYDGKVVGIIRGHYADGNRDSICTPGPVLCSWLRETIGYVPQCNSKRPAVKPSPIAVAPTPPRDDDGRTLAMLESIDKRLRRLETMPLPRGESGPPGEPGQMGPVGPRGEKGERGPAGLPADSMEIRRLRQEIDALRNARITVQIKQNGTLIDEDSYPITGPIVLDFRATEKRSVSASREE